MQCWIVSFCLETMQLTSLLTEITDVEQAAHLTCSLKLANCQAVSSSQQVFIFYRLYETHANSLKFQEESF